MLIRKGFRFRIYPTLAQQARFIRWEGTLRWLWNLALEQRRIGLARPKDERRFPTAFDQINELTELRAALPWLADVPRAVCAQLLVELDKAWQRCFQKLAKAPRWKRKGRNTLGLCEPHPKAFRINGDVLRFPKIGNIDAIVHRPLEGKPKTCTIRRDGDQWFASILCEIETTAPALRTSPIVAIDRGIAVLAATSDGELIENPHYLKQAATQLAHAQRVVCRRKKGSKNREKAKLRVMRIHRKVRRQREHYLHQVTTALSKNHAIVVVEKLQIRNMTASAKGTVEAPGTNVRQKSGLNRSILDAGWGRMVEMLRYKLAWNGGTVVEVPAAYSSQTCSSCSYIDAANRPAQAVFYCQACGYSDHADLNAAKVLLSRANRSVLPVEGDSTRRSRKVLRTVKRASQSFDL